MLPATRRSRLVLAGAVVAVVLVLFDAGLIWQHQRSAFPLLLAAPAPVMASPAAQPSTISAAAGAVTAATVDASWVSAISARTDIPARALAAYANAQLTEEVSQPACHVGWTMLAGIGSVESSNGRSGGSTLRADGTTSRIILGPALDGTHGNMVVHATPAGIRMDGDPRWDHAIGPMQFIPSTWIRWGRAPDGAGLNPNDIDDAALTAARYLCADGRDLATARGWHAAVAAYNAPDAYAIKVTGVANAYADESRS